MSFTVQKGYNFRILDTDDFGRICFGCPPGVVKDFSQREESLPSKYVLPLRTFVNGTNRFDFEFILYTYLFIKPGRQKVSIFCTEDQKNRFKAIFEETLFGPNFYNLLKAEFHRFGRVHHFSAEEKEYYLRFIEKLSRNKKLWNTFESQLARHVPDRDMHGRLADIISALLENERWLASKKIKNMEQAFAQHYARCAQLKIEMELFALAKEEDREAFLENVADFHVFDSTGVVEVKGDVDKRKKLKIHQVRPSEFEVYQNNILRCRFDIVNLDRHSVPTRIEKAEKPYMGVTFLGVGSGFTHKRHNSCMIAWSEGKGIMVDAFSDNDRAIVQHGISGEDVPYMFLTHIHSDHDAGFIEKILSGQRLKVLSSRIIFESFLRKIQAVTLFPVEVLENLVDFIELEPYKKTKLPGFKRTFIEFDYAFHSIPTGRFKLIHKDEDGKTRTIAHSGDTKYDRDLVNSWYEHGHLSPDRREQILGFIWDADLIMHDVGGGPIHTDFESLLHLDPELARKVILVHHDREPPEHPYMRSAHEGQTEVLIKGQTIPVKPKVEDLKHAGLFRNTPEKELEDIIQHSQVLEFQANDVVFAKGDVGDSFYIILDGFAEIILNKRKSIIYEKGMFFGELAISTENPRRRATVKAMSRLILVQVPKEYYSRVKMPKITDDFYKLGNFFNSSIRPGLVASLGEGDLVQWSKNEKIFEKGIRKGDVFVILSGQVEIPTDRNGESEGVFLSSGDVLGEITSQERSIQKLLCGTDMPKTSNALAASERVSAVRLKSQQLSKIFKSYPSFFGTVYQRMKKLQTVLC
ncbi:MULTISPECIES: cyclic nucleotide-binding domain-containing protein [unclassified Nitrospina]|uniref:cyclic nucleotide-binding domain-containing protein n=1 Tax=unclassified Nitrospina TaxID=2638683 RepID=UPI003F9B1192